MNRPDRIALLLPVDFSAPFRLSSFPYTTSTNQPREGSEEHKTARVKESIHQSQLVALWSAASEPRQNACILQSTMETCPALTVAGSCTFFSLSRSICLTARAAAPPPEAAGGRRRRPSRRPGMSPSCCTLLVTTTYPCTLCDRCRFVLTPSLVFFFRFLFFSPFPPFLSFSFIIPHQHQNCLRPRDTTGLSTLSSRRAG